MIRTQEIVEIVSRGPWQVVCTLSHVRNMARYEYGSHLEPDSDHFLHANTLPVQVFRILLWLWLPHTYEPATEYSGISF